MWHLWQPLATSANFGNVQKVGRWNHPKFGHGFQLLHFCRIIFQESLGLEHIRTDDFCRLKNWMNLCYPDKSLRIYLPWKNPPHSNVPPAALSPTESRFHLQHFVKKLPKVGNPAKRHGVARTRTWLALRMCLGKVSVLACRPVIRSGCG